MKCNCQKSKCLKLYCECFAAGELCYDCNCCNCANIPDNAYVRSLIINKMKDRNPSAFKSKIEAQKETVKHIKGCNCTKSGCLKKYCECYQIGATCTDLCRCRDCKNVDSINSKLNNLVRVIDENTLIIKKKCLGDNIPSMNNHLKFHNFDKFQTEKISIQILDNSMQFDQRIAKLNEDKFASVHLFKSNKKHKKRAKRLIIKHKEFKILKSKNKEIFDKQLNTPIKNTCKLIKSSILNNSSQIKKNLFTPKNRTASLLLSTTDKTHKRKIKKQVQILCENLNERLTHNKKEIILNENY